RLQSELGDARVFTVGIDTAVNDGFLRRLAALGGGTSTFVEPGGRLEEALQAVGREIGTPLVTDLRIDGEVAEVAPARIPDLFAGFVVVDDEVVNQGGTRRTVVQPVEMPADWDLQQVREALKRAGSNSRGVSTLHRATMGRMRSAIAYGYAGKAPSPSVPGQPMEKLIGKLSPEKAATAAEREK